MGREDNIRIFQDTEKHCKTNEKLKASVKYATAGQKLIRESDIIPEQNRNLYQQAAKVTTSKPVLMPEKDWYSVDVITCAAPKLQPK